MSTNDASDNNVAAKCPELTNGCWPAWWYHTTLRLQKEGVLGLVTGDWTQPKTQGRSEEDRCDLLHQQTLQVRHLQAWRAMWRRLLGGR